MTGDLFISRQMFLSEFACGWVAGAAGVMGSHPLDTIRVRMQNLTPSRISKVGIMDMLKKIVAGKEGPVGLYKGLFSPVLSVGMWKSTLFVFSSATIKYLERPPVAGAAPDWKHDLTQVQKMFFGGCGGQLLAFFIVMPTENVKVVAQMQKDRTVGLRHEYNIFRKIVTEEGALSVWRGGLAFQLGMIPTMGILFAANEWLLQKLAVFRGGDEKIPFFERVLVGGLAGSLSWALCYPFDKIKTQYQTQRDVVSYKDIIGPMYRKHGLKYFTSGMTATIVRGFPQCGITMSVYHVLRQRVDDSVFDF